ncbi:MAG: carboxypeptidase regulatory-like domain-containing protein [Acidobacteria bacterium]|nr:carboxypeptidase regulatory-like domain-containing protein [Acidobacteriota bacterium]
MFKQMFRVICLLGVLSLSTIPVWAQAQSSSADLTGTILDPSKAVVRDARVTATNLSTGLIRAATTDSVGSYRIPLLPPGQYEVKVEVNGFNTQIKRGITLTVGQIAVINFEMTVGVTKDVEVVDTDAPVIEIERTHQASTITQMSINQLPINGRNFLDFARLTPGVVEESPTVTSVQVAALTTSGLSFSGQNGRANSVLIDGVDNNDIGSNGVRPTISQEAVSEFQINRNGYNAEFGRASGGVINIVSKSGSNEFHGNIYNYFRNERLDARNTFATSQRQDPPFKRNQPGFTFGGPIKRDKTFFFAAYEGLIRRESAFTTILTDPSILQPTAGQQDLINTLVGSSAPALVAQGQQLQRLLSTGPDSPFPSAGQPLPLNRINYNWLAGSTGAFPILQTTSTGSFRLDHAFSEQDYFFFRYSLTNDSQHNLGIGGQIAPSAGFDIANRDSTFILGGTHIFHNGASNEFRFQNVRNVYNADTVDPFGPRFRLAGIGEFGREFFSPSDRTQRRIQFLDNFSLTRGNHTIKFGADFSRYTFNTISAVFLGGNIDFAQLPVPLGMVLGSATAAQLATALATPREAGGLGRPDLVPVITTQPLTTVQQMNFGLARVINQGFGNPNAEFTGHILGLYLQDGVRVKPNLYLSFGLRYDYEIQPVGTPRDSNNFGPRISFAYDPSKKGRTMIRGGGGLYYQSLYTGTSFASSILGRGQISNILVSADPRLTPVAPNSPCGQALATGVPPSFCFYQQLIARGLLKFPSTASVPESAYSELLGLTRETSTNRLLVRLAGNAVNPYSVQGALGIDHQLGRDWNISINYLVNHGVKLIRTRQVNALPDARVFDAFGRPALLGRADPTRLVDFVLETAGNSIHHGLTVEMNKRFSRFYQVIGSYTFGKTIADAADILFEQGPEDPTNTRADRGLSSFDVRHRLSVAAIIDSPFRGGSGSLWRQRALADFYFSPIFTVRSGFPFDIRTGLDINLDNNVNDRPFAVGRNTGIGPGFFTVDLRVGRRLRFGADSSQSLEFIFDAFNLFNRVNFKEVNGNTGGVLFLDQLGVTDVRIKGRNDKAASTFCGFTSAYEPRIIQIALKYNF